MKSKNTPTSGDAKSAACPLASLVLLAATHHRQDATELLEPLGVGQVELDKFAAENAAAMETMKQTAIAGALLDRSTFASLMRVRVGVKLIETEDPRHLAVLVTAAAKLPAWVFGEEEPAAKHTGNGLLTNGLYHNANQGMPDLSALGTQRPIAEAKPRTTQRQMR